VNVVIEVFAGLGIAAIALLVGLLLGEWKFRRDRKRWGLK